MTEWPAATAKRTAPPSLTAILGRLREGVVILDRDRRIAYLNDAARRRLASPDSATAEAGPFVVPAASDAIEVGLNIDGEPATAVIMRDRIEPGALDQRRLVAFARTAARAGCTGSLQSTLDELAGDVLGVTGAVTCNVAVIDPATGEISVIGMAGDTRDHLSRVEEAIRRGAPLRTLTAAGNRAPFVERDLAALVRNDERFAPLAPTVDEGHWTSLVAAPLVVRDVSLGALTAYYSAPADPDEAEVAFIGAMADQAAIAVNTSLLFAEAQDKATLEERNRLARDLHDSVAQNLYSLVLQARAAQAAAARLGGDEAMSERLDTLHTLAQAALDDMRSAIGHLRAPAAAADSGLATAVREHAAAVAEREHIEVGVTLPDEPLLLSVEAEDELFRVIAEALANSVRHGRPTRIDIDIAEPRERDELVITLTDNGTGFDPSRDRPGHIGLASMRERTERLGGRLTVDSSGGGTTIRAVVPCRRWPPRRLGSSR